MYLIALNTGKKEKIFLIFKEIQMGSVAKSYMRKDFLIYFGEMREYFTIYEEAVSHFATDPFWIFLYVRKLLVYFLSVYFQYVNDL